MEETNKQNRKGRFVRRDADAVEFLLLLGVWMASKALQGGSG